MTTLAHNVPVLARFVSTFNQKYWIMVKLTITIGFDLKPMSHWAMTVRIMRKKPVAIYLNIFVTSELCTTIYAANLLKPTAYSSWKQLAELCSMSFIVFRYPH